MNILIIMILSVVVSSLVLSIPLMAYSSFIFNQLVKQKNNSKFVTKEP